jgi:hypothetical protein
MSESVAPGHHRGRCMRRRCRAFSNCELGGAFRRRFLNHGDGQRRGSNSGAPVLPTEFLNCAMRPGAGELSRHLGATIVWELGLEGAFLIVDFGRSVFARRTSEQRR